MNDTTTTGLRVEAAFLALTLDRYRLKLAAIQRRTTSAPRRKDTRRANNLSTLIQQNEEKLAGIRASLAAEAS